jgi:alkanesulfonate monooxygenase SsuD/methylene tetrahydromethanopterin reductase-like flavin-dependent oxidoreductase (luciferase family)
MNFNVIIAQDEARLEAKKASIRERFDSVPPIDGERTLASWYGGPEAAVGTPEMIAETLSRFAAEGMDYAIVYLPDAAYDPESLELFASEVMPAFT